MRKNKINALLLAAALFFTAAPIARAESIDGLEKVDFHAQYTDAQGEQALRDGVEMLWEVIEPLAARQGRTSFPRAGIWGFNDVRDASRISGINSSRWRGLSGYASGDKAYVLFDDKASSIDERRLVAHEAMHVVQYSLSGSNKGSQCIVEGAGEWYSHKASGSNGGKPLRSVIDDFKSINSEDRITGVSEETKKQLEEYGYEPNPLPAFSELSTSNQFRQAFDERGGQIYALCVLAFDLLIETGGGEDAYFEYMSELRRTNWRTAFNRTFDEDLETFKKRFKAYRESWFEDYRLPREIEHEKFINELLDCRRSGLWAQKVCIQ